MRVSRSQPIVYNSAFRASFMPTNTSWPPHELEDPWYTHFIRALLGHLSPAKLHGEPSHAQRSAGVRADPQKKKAAKEAGRERRRRRGASPAQEVRARD